MVIIIFLWKNENYINKITYLEDFKRAPYDLPIQSAKEAMNFFLDQEDVKKEIKSRKGRWWIEVRRSDLKNLDNIWGIGLGNGEGRCASSYQCYMHIYDDGKIKTPMKCSDGWNCE